MGWCYSTADSAVVTVLRYAPDPEIPPKQLRHRRAEHGGPVSAHVAVSHSALRNGQDRGLAAPQVPGCLVRGGGYWRG
jgi:hypothetical protein